MPAWKTISGTLSDTISSFLKDRAMRLSAALAFYSIFSLGPVLVILVVLAGLIWGEKAVRGQLVDEFSTAVGPDAAKQIQSIVAAARQTEGSTLATIVGILLLLLASTAVFNQLRDALNTVWDVQPSRQSALWTLIKGRLLGLGIVLAIAVLFAAMIMASTVLSALSDRMPWSLPLPVPTMRIAEFVLSWAVSTLLFAAIFKWLPEVRLAWRDVWIGAAATALLFNIGKVALGWYLSRGSIASVYGAAGSLVVILLWIYYSSMIFLFGAELTQAIARRTGKRIEAKDDAVPLNHGDRIEQGLEHKPAGEPHHEQIEGSPRATNVTAHPLADKPRTRAAADPLERLIVQVATAVAEFALESLKARIVQSARRCDHATRATRQPPRSTALAADINAPPSRARSTSAASP